MEQKNNAWQHGRWAVLCLGIVVLCVLTMHYSWRPVVDEGASSSGDIEAVAEFDAGRDLGVSSKGNRVKTPKLSVSSHVNDGLTTLTISGVITSPEKQAIPGAQVSVNNALVRLPREADVKTAVTDTNGSYCLQVYGKRDSVWRLRANATGYAEAYGVVSGRGKNACDWSVSLGRFAAVSGIVVDEGGVGLSGVDVYAHPAQSSTNYARVSSACSSVVKTGVDGSYTIADVPEKTPVHIIADASAKGYQLGLTDSIESPRSDIRIVLQQGGCTITGHVVDHVGTPVAGSQVLLFMTSVLKIPLSSIADKQGAFRFDGILPLRPMIMFAVGRSHYNSDVSNEAFCKLSAGETTDVVLRFDPPSTRFAVRGKLIDDGTGAPLAGKKMRLYWVDGRRQGNWGSETTNGNGEFVVHDVEGNYDVFFYDDGLFPAVRQDAPLAISTKERSRISRIVPDDFHQVEDSIVVRAVQVPQINFKVVASDRQTVEKQAKIYIAEGNSGKYYDGDGTCKICIPPEMPDERTFVAIGIKKTGTGDRDLLLGTEEVTAGEERRAVLRGEMLTRKLVLERPEFWTKCSVRSVTSRKMSPEDRLHLVFRNTKKGEESMTQLWDVAYDPTRSGFREFPVLPGYEVGIRYGWYSEQTPGSLASVLYHADLWLLPEECIGKELELDFNDNNKTLVIRK